ncbi:hypothetical protein Ssed_2202 [Shewanella sediminis HAW-EB3]|uniref:Structural protein P5 n=1 Tax=Shewanella sediminis (strain HAW-EB3) TaxID=425104 RepID=A8FVD8_SHESH|nr:hypothetical protein [Shewanella sediminis]ABV36811.1 hypothetical protein Ssed_2202 [Shewanella sediminis HAW-EB3]
MRRMMIITAGAVCAAGAWWWLKSPRSTPVAVNSSSPGQTSGADSPLDYLNFDFNKILSGDSNMPISNKPYQQSGGDPVPKGIRNNNPLNIEAGRDQWQGMKGDDGRFIIFESPFWGIRAAARTLKTYRDKWGLNNVQDIVTRWAPPSDNNPTDKYISFVARKAGVLASQPLGAADYPRVVSAMIHFENGYNPYDEITISNATAEGFA